MEKISHYRCLFVFFLFFFLLPNPSSTQGFLFLFFLINFFCFVLFCFLQSHSLVFKITWSVHPLQLTDSL